MKQEPMPIAWINGRAQSLNRILADELQQRWPKHSILTRQTLIESVARQYLGDLWEYRVDEIIGDVPFRMRITRYLGPVEES